MPVTCCFAPADVRSAAEAAERRDGAVPRSCCSLAGKCETLCPSADARLEAPVLALLARARAAVLCPRARVVDVYAQPYCTGLGPPLYSMASILFLILSHSFFPLLLCVSNHTVSPYCACRITILRMPYHRTAHAVSPYCAYRVRVQEPVDHVEKPLSPAHRLKNIGAFIEAASSQLRVKVSECWARQRCNTRVTQATQPGSAWTLARARARVWTRARARA